MKKTHKPYGDFAPRLGTPKKKGRPVRSKNKVTTGKGMLENVTTSSAPLGLLTMTTTGNGTTVKVKRYRKGHPSTKKLADLKMTDAQREEYVDLLDKASDSEYNFQRGNRWYEEYDLARKEVNLYAKKADQAGALALFFGCMTIGLILILML